MSENSVLRPLTLYELSIIERLLSEEFAGRDELLVQLASASAEPTGDPDNYGAIYLTTESEMKASVKWNMPVRGIGHDIDGIPIEFVLHVKDGFLQELDIVRLAGNPIIRHPPAETLELFIRERNQPKDL